MKKRVSLGLVLMLLVTSIMPAFAEGVTGPVGGDDTIVIQPDANRFKYEYEETDYAYHTTGIVTEEDIAAAMRMAAHELNAIGYIFGGLALKPINAAMAAGVTKKQLMKIVTKSLRNAGAIGITERITSAGLTELRFKATKRVVEKKYKYKYRVNLATGRRTKEATWVTFRTKVYYRSGPSSSWRYSKTETKTVKER